MVLLVAGITYFYFIRETRYEVRGTISAVNSESLSIKGVIKKIGQESDQEKDQIMEIILTPETKYELKALVPPQNYSGGTFVPQEEIVAGAKSDLDSGKVIYIIAHRKPFSEVFKARLVQYSFIKI